jgi:hypothetical protein
MTASVHFATGAASALLVQRFLSSKYDWNYDVGRRYMFGFLAGVASHLIFDAVPHAEYSMKGEALLSILCLEAAVMMWILLSNQGPVMSQLLAWGLVGGALPDVMGMAGKHLDWQILVWPYEIFHLTHDKAELFFASYAIQSVIVVACIIYVRFKTAK